MMKHVDGSLAEYLKLTLYIRKEERELTAPMMDDHPPRSAIRATGVAIGVRIIGRRIGQVQMLLHLKAF